MSNRSIRPQQERKIPLTSPERKKQKVKTPPVLTSTAPTSRSEERPPILNREKSSSSQASQSVGNLEQGLKHTVLADGPNNTGSSKNNNANTKNDANFHKDHQKKNKSFMKNNDGRKGEIRKQSSNASSNAELPSGKAKRATSNHSEKDRGQTRPNRRVGGVDDDKCLQQKQLAAWKREQNLYDIKLTNSLHEVKQAVLEQAQNLLLLYHNKSHDDHISDYSIGSTSASIISADGGRRDEDSSNCSIQSVCKLANNTNRKEQQIDHVPSTLSSRSRSQSDTESIDSPLFLSESLPTPITEPAPDAFIQKITVFFRSVPDIIRHQKSQRLLQLQKQQLQRSFPNSPASSTNSRSKANHSSRTLEVDTEKDPEADFVDMDTSCADYSVIGFLFTYSDGVTTEIGNLKGTSSTSSSSACSSMSLSSSSSLSSRNTQNQDAASVSLLVHEHVVSISQTMWKNTSFSYRQRPSIGIRKLFFHLRRRHFSNGSSISGCSSGGISISSNSDRTPQLQQQQEQQVSDRIICFEGGEVVETGWLSGEVSFEVENNRTSQNNTESYIMRSLEWSSDKLMVTKLISQPRPSPTLLDDDIDNNSSHFNADGSVIPTLQYLATKALPESSQEMKVRLKHAEEKAYVIVEPIVMKAQSDLLGYFMEKRIEPLKEIQKCLQKELEKECSSSNTNSKHDPKRGSRQLSQQQYHIQRALRCKRRALTFQYKEYNDFSRRKANTILKALRQVNALKQEFQLVSDTIQVEELYRKHHIQLRTVSALKGENDESTALCKNAKCFRIFEIAHVRERQRCAVDGCFWTWPSCGCDVESCKRCHVSYCPRHKKSHDMECKLTIRSRCGWKKGVTGLKPELCGRVIQHGEGSETGMATSTPFVQCVICSVQCCEDCCIPCKRRNPLSEVCQLHTKDDNNKVYNWCIDCKAKYSHVS